MNQAQLSKGNELVASIKVYQSLKKDIEDDGVSVRITDCDGEIIEIPDELADQLLAFMKRAIEVETGELQNLFDKL
jgi:hypothetical protein